MSEIPNELKCMTFSKNDISRIENEAYQQGREDAFQEIAYSDSVIKEPFETLAYNKGRADGAKEFAEWLPQHFDLRFNNNPDVWLDEFFNHTREKVLAEWQKGAEE